MSLKLPFIEDEIIDQYLYDDNPRPWIIGFSGGKDSTVLTREPGLKAELARHFERYIIKGRITDTVHG